MTEFWEESLEYFGHGYLEDFQKKSQKDLLKKVLVELCKKSMEEIRIKYQEEFPEKSLEIVYVSFFGKITKDCTKQFLTSGRKSWKNSERIP